MRWIAAFFLVFVPLAVQGHEKKFLESWERYDEFLAVSGDRGLQYRKKVSIPFGSLASYPGEVKKPGEINNEIETAYRLWSQKDVTLLIVTPKNTLKQMLLDEEYKQTLKQCREDRSWLVVLPENEWVEIELNPYCTMHYSEDQVVIDLYWADSSKRPFVDIITNDLTCVPHHLYGWDRALRTYVLRSAKCTGNRPFENYSGNDVQSRQLYPPVSRQ